MGCAAKTAKGSMKLNQIIQWGSGPIIQRHFSCEGLQYFLECFVIQTITILSTTQDPENSYLVGYYKIP